MNRSYRLVFNSVRGAWIAAPETARGAAKGAGGRRLTGRAGRPLRTPLALGSLALALAAAFPAWAAEWNAGNGDWNTAGNWDTNGVPDGSTNVYILHGGAVRVEQPGASAASLTVGSDIPSSLTINNGGTLSSTDGFIAAGVASPTGSGTVTVTGSGSAWINSGSLTLGVGFSTGVLNISGGGVVVNTSGLVGASGSTVLVTGVGSTWTNNGDLRVGEIGTGNLTVSAGGRVNSVDGFVGNDGFSSVGTVTITGTGSLWNASGNAVLGAGSTGTLNLLEQGRMSVAGGLLTLGRDGAGRGTLNIGNGGAAGVIDTATIAGGAGAAVLNFNHNGTNYYFTRDGTAGGGAINITGGIAVNVTGGGTTTLTGNNSYTGGTTVAAGSTLRGAAGALQGAIANDGNVTFDQAVNTTGTYSGSMSGGGRLAKEGAGLLILTGNNTYTGGTTVSAGTLQGNATSLQGNILNNAAVVFDQAANTTGTYNGNISGSGGVTKIGDGTLILSGAGTYTGNTNVSGGTLAVTGSLTGGNAVNVDSGQLNVTAGGAISNANSTLGSVNGSTGAATVAGSGSTWTSSGSMIVGDAGTGTLNISGGGRVGNAAGTVGNSGAGGNSVTVSGANSVWANSDTLTIGNAGTGNSLSIEAGARVTNTSAFVGVNSGAGSVTVNGAAARWESSGSLDIGLNGTGSLNISGAGTVSNTSGTIGSVGSGTGVVTVDGSGSTWTNSGSLTVGLSGTGSLTISGGAAVSDTGGGIGAEAGSSGTVTVSGTGSTWTKTGVLNVGVGGSGTLNISAGGVVSNTDGAIGALPSGSGTVTASGTGTSWTNSGSLLIGSGGTGNLTVSGGATVTNTSGVVAAFAGAGTALVTGAGSTWTSNGDLRVGDVGTGSLTVSAGGRVNSVDGFVGNGVTRVGTATITGAGSLWNASGNAVLGAGGTGTLNLLEAGRMNVAGGLITLGRDATGRGTLNIGNGGAAGIFSSASIVGGTGGGTVNFNHTNGSYYFTSDGTAAGAANVLSGNLAVNVAGSGKTVLLGANTYTGGTTVNGGTLAVNGSITGNATVNSGGTLGGSGTVGAVSVMSGGVLAPGNSIGTLSVAGNVTFNAGSIYRVETDAAGNADRVNATGQVIINGGTVDVQAGAGTYARNTTYTILNGATGRTGAFAGVTSNLAFLTPTLTYDANNVFLTLATSSVDSATGAASYTGVAATQNQLAVAGALDKLLAAGGNALTGQVDNLSAGQARNAFEGMSGSQHASASQVGSAMSRGFGEAVMGHAGSGAGGAGGAGFGGTGMLRGQSIALGLNGGGIAGVSGDAPVQLMGMSLSGVMGDAAAGSAMGSSASASSLGLRAGSNGAPVRETGVSAGDTGTAASGLGLSRATWGSNAAGQNGIWGQALGLGGRIASDGNGAGSSYRGGGFIVGLDLTLTSQWLVGVAGGYTRATWDANTNGNAPANGKVTTPQGSVYARYSSGPWMVSFAGTYADHKFDTTRTITIGTASNNATSSHRGNEWGFSSQAEYALAAGAWQLRPLAGVRYARLKEDGFSENGSSLANLTVNERSTESTTVSAGMRVLRPFNATSAADGGVEFRAVYSHLFGDNDSPVSARLGGQAASFTANGTPLKRDAVTIGAGVSAKLGKNFSGYLDASYEARGSGQDAYAIGAGLRYAW